MRSRGERFHEPVLPEGFLWGAATSAHQVEGGNTHSDWWAAETAGEVPHASGRACGHRERFEQDIELLAASGLNAYRFSVEWARVQPAPEIWADGELRRYVAMAEACRRRGVTPLLTLNHFTLPAWAARRGGWLWPGAVAAFARYAERVARAMDGAVELYATINEPGVLSLQAYLEGIWPPRRHSLPLSVAVARRLSLAHRAAYAAVRAASSAARVGAVKQLVHFRPLRPWRPGDRLLAHAVRRAFNEAWLDSVADVLDWIGVNYYTAMYCGGLGARPPHPAALIRARPDRPKTDMGWEVHPAGLRRVLQSLRRFGLPVYITENGIATGEDALRRRFIRQHLLQAVRAIGDGLDLRGYFHWSLLDNFEWTEGYAMRFGLVAVRGENLERVPRASLGYLGEMARANTVLGPDRSGDDPSAALA